MITYILFVVGFIILIKGADLLVDGSSSIARKFQVSNLVIGLTLVSFGTSAPELIINLVASFEGKQEIAIGNILGSNIANTLLILGISALIYPLAVHKSTVWKEIPYSVLAVLVLGFLVNGVIVGGESQALLSRFDGLILLVLFIVFIFYTFSIAKKHNELSDVQYKELEVFQSVVYTVLGILGLGFGGPMIVNGAVKIAQNIGMSESFIGLTIIALGTSLPELATSAVAAYKRNTDIAIGNVVGSNIFNVLWILGISSVIKP
ncbi:MAG: calcium/sodium antiporter, partial [Ignavibacteria bacterium]|nr:calcium/sodium antiporter [Ignavibacteria bacterium]